MIELDADELLKNALRDGIREGVKFKLSGGYNNPLDKMIEKSIEAHSEEFRVLLHEGLASCLGDGQFREDIKTEIRHILAKTLVQRFGGEIEKSVNALKSDPTTRARITVAIEDIVKAKTA